VESLITENNSQPMLPGLVALCAKQGDRWLSPRAVWRILSPDALMAILPNRLRYYLFFSQENYENYWGSPKRESRRRRRKQNKRKIIKQFLDAAEILLSILNITLAILLAILLAMTSGTIKSSLYLPLSILYGVSCVFLAITQTLKTMFTEPNKDSNQQQASNNTLFKQLFTGWQPNARDILIALTTALFIAAVIFSVGSALGIISATALPGFATTILSPFTSVFTAFTAWATPGLTAIAALVGWHATHAVTILAAVSFSLLSYACACLTFTVLEKILLGNRAIKNDDYLSFKYYEPEQNESKPAAEESPRQVSTFSRFASNVAGFF
jgi:hypothetical protein